MLLAIVNANYEFLMVHFGTNGRISDGGVIENTNFYTKLQNGGLKIPPPCSTKQSRRALPFVFIGDEAFALREDFLKPFSEKQLNHDRRIFNYRLSRCRRIVENVFGILVARFRIFHTAINMKLENIDKVVMACCVLHIFLRRTQGNTYSPSTCLDHEDMGRGEIQLGCRPEPHTLLDIQRGPNRNATQYAKEVRNAYMEYFCNEGCVNWQERYV